MSHEATNWAFKVKGLKPATKIVLLGLADCHNPALGCFPSKKHLAEACEMSERSVADHLIKLEEAGLIRMEKRTGGNSGHFASNRYILGFEEEFCRGQDLPSAKSAVGKNDASPSAKSAGHRRQNLPNNPVREPSKGTSKGARAILCEVLSEEIADAYIDHRKAKRAKLTERAAELIVKKIKDHPDPNAVVEESIANGWTGVFPEKSRATSSQQSYGYRPSVEQEWRPGSHIPSQIFDEMFGEVIPPPANTGRQH